jgi:phosphoglycerate dehydrogenase-like enzyme
MNIHLIQTPTTEGLKILQDELDTGIWLTFGNQIPKPSEYDVLVSGNPSREFIVASPNLKILVIPWAGIPDSTRVMMMDFPEISVHNLHHNAAPTAETALALLFAAAKFIIPFDKALRVHDWRPRYQPNPSMLLQGKTALILGYGAIGQYLGNILRAMKMRVLAVRRNQQNGSEDKAEIFSIKSLTNLLPQADVLIIALPGTPETEGLIGKYELSLLPKGTVLVNIGRGPIVAEEALYHALRERHLRAAGIDVWYNYPSDNESHYHTPPSVYNFHELDNIVMSPHRGGGSEDSEQLRMEHLAALLNAIARGESIPNRVDLIAGY